MRRGPVPLTKRVLAGVSRRTRRPELLAAFDRLARRDLRDELAMRAILAAKLRAESTFVDVGANTGQWTKDALRCAPGGRHLAFEPVPALHEEMTRALPEV